MSGTRDLQSVLATSLVDDQETPVAGQYIEQCSLLSNLRATGRHTTGAKWLSAASGTRFVSDDHNATIFHHLSKGLDQ
jgi:hypothetical protein